MVSGRETNKSKKRAFLWVFSYIKCGADMDDREFRTLELYLKNRGIQCYRFMNMDKIDALYRAGYRFLFFSFFGENIFTGDAEMILLVKSEDGRVVSAHLLRQIERFGLELVSREKAAA